MVSGNASSADLEVVWDALLGFPSSISVDVIENAVDDEFDYTVTDFRRAS